MLKHGFMWPPASLPLEGWAAHRTGLHVEEVCCFEKAPFFPISPNRIQRLTSELTKYQPLCSLQSLSQWSFWFLTLF